MDVDCEIDRALITLDNFKSSIEALFEINVYRGDIDPVNYVDEESGHTTCRSRCQFSIYETDTAQWRPGA